MKLSTFFDLLKEDTTETRIIRNGNTIDMSAIGNHVYYNSEIESIRIADDDIIEISVKPGGGASMFTTEQKDMYITFKSLARATARSLTDMAELWERMETDTQILPLCGDSYPFEGSFDDVAFQFAYWVTDFQDKPIDYGQKPETTPYTMDCFSSGGGFYHCVMSTDSNQYYEIDNDHECLTLYNKWNPSPYFSGDSELFDVDGMVYSVYITEMSSEQKAVYNLMRSALNDYMGV